MVQARKFSSRSTIILNVDVFAPQTKYVVIMKIHHYLAHQKSKFQIVHFRIMEVIINHLLKMVILMQVNIRVGLILFSINLIMIIQTILERIRILVVKNGWYDRHAEKCFGMKENRNKKN